MAKGGGVDVVRAAVREIARLRSALAAAEREADALYGAAYEAYFVLDRILFTREPTPMSKKKQPKSGAPKRAPKMPRRPAIATNETARATAHAVTGIPLGKGVRVDRQSALEIARAVVAIRGGSGEDTGSAESMITELEESGFFKLLDEG